MVTVSFVDGTKWESQFRWRREMTDCCPLLYINSDEELVVPELIAGPDEGQTADLAIPGDMGTALPGG